MKRSISWNSSSSDSDDDGSDSKRSNNNVSIDQPSKEETSEELVIRRAEMYQDYMNRIPIPPSSGSSGLVIAYHSWTELAKSIKQIYGQPLHYLTNILIKQWDIARIGSEDEDKPLDTIVHPRKAETTIWRVEEVHRLTTSHHYLASCWLSDPMPHAFIDPIFP